MISLCLTDTEKFCQGSLRWTIVTHFDIFTVTSTTVMGLCTDDTFPQWTGKARMLLSLAAPPKRQLPRQ